MEVNKNKFFERQEANFNSLEFLMKVCLWICVDKDMNLNIKASAYVKHVHSKFSIKDLIRKDGHISRSPGHYGFDHI